MRILKSAFVLILGLILISGVFAGGRQGDGRTRVTIAGTDGPGAPQSLGMEEFARRLNALGGWNAVAMVSSEMGSTDDATEQGIQGAPVISGSDPSRMAVHVPEIGILMMPFLFTDYSQLDALMDTPLMQEWIVALRRHGVELLTANLITGWRNWVTNVPIRTPADLNGLRIRTMGTPIALRSVEAMGAVPIAMAQGEAYHAIQTRVVDGGEWQIGAIYAGRFFEVANHISMSGHFLLTGSMVTGTRWFDTLSPLQQTQLRETAIQNFRDNKAVVVEMEERLLNEMRTRHGVTVVQDVDRRAFQEATVHLFDDPVITQGVDFRGLRAELFRQLGIN